jgi:hypothetical protein
VVEDLELDDEELTALALAAAPDQEVGPDAVPIDVAGATTSGLLPEWYMPAPMAGGRGRVRRVTLGLLGLALVVVNAAGLCVTYGFPEIAW